MSYIQSMFFRYSSRKKKIIQLILFIINNIKSCFVCMFFFAYVPNESVSHGAELMLASLLFVGKLATKHYQGNT